MAELRDGLVAEALEHARRGDREGAQEALDRAARVWPVEEEQVESVRAALGAPLLDPNRAAS